MAAPLIARLIMDASGYLKTVDTAIASNTKLDASFQGVGETASVSASRQVEASLKASKALQVQVAGLRELAGSATASAETQARATLLADRAQSRLNSQLGLSVVATRGAGKEAQTAGRDVRELSRGLLAGSGAASEMGRSLAFASTGFVAVAGGATILKDSISAAIELAKTQRQVEAQLKTSGKSWDQYGTQIDAVLLKESRLSGFTKQELLQGFGYLVRVNGNVEESLRLTGVAADVARGRNISLSAAAIALAKALGGSTTALKRLGITIPANVKGMDALNYVQAKFAGQAQAGSTAGDRFHATLVDTEEIIGTALLPTFTRLTTELGDWLQRMNESGRLEKDVNRIVTDTGHAFHFVEGAITVVDKVTGGFAHTMELIIGLRIAATVAKWVVSFKELAVALGIVKTAAEGAAAAEAAAGAGGLANAVARGAGGGGGIVAAGRFAGKGAAIEAAAPFAPFLAIPAIASFAGVQGPKRVTVRAYTASGEPVGVGSDGKHYVVTPRGLVPVNDQQAESLIVSVKGVAGAPVITTQLANLPTTRNIVPPAFQASGFQPAPLPSSSQTSPLFGGISPIQVWTAFQLTLNEQINQVEAGMTRTLADDVAVAKEIIARIRHLIDIGKLAPGTQAYLQALQAEASAESTLQSAQAAAAQKRQEAAAKALQLASSYTTPIDLQIAEVQAQMTRSTRDDLRVERQIIAAARRTLADGKKNKQGQLAALETILQAQQAIQALTSQSNTTSTLPLKLQLSLAKAQALGIDQAPILEKMKAALEKALKAAKGNIQKQIDIWNQISSINQQLGQGADNAYGDYRKASLRWETAGLGLSADQRRQFEQRLSQVGPGGTRPMSGTGAAGYIIDPDTGRPIDRRRHGRATPTAPVGGRPNPYNPTIDLNVYIDGNQVEATVTNRQHRRRRHMPTQTRGPHAATASA